MLVSNSPLRGMLRAADSGIDAAHCSYAKRSRQLLRGSD